MIPYSLAALIALVAAAAAFFAGALFALLIGLKVMDAYDKIGGAKHDDDGDDYESDDEPDELDVDLTQPHELEGATL